MENFFNYKIKLNNIIKGIVIIIFYVLMMELIITKSILHLITFSINSYLDKPSDEWPEQYKLVISALYNIIIYVIIFIPLAFLDFDELKMDYYRVKHNKQSFKKTFFIFLGIFYLTAIIVGRISTALYDRTSTNQEAINELLTKDNILIIPFIIVVCVIGPIVEEIVYRRAIFSVLRNKYLSIIVSSTIFGMIHILTTDDTIYHLIVISLPYFASGVIYSLAYEKSNHNLWLPALVHIFNNSLSIVLILLL